MIPPKFFFFDRNGANEVPMLSCDASEVFVVFRRTEWRLPLKWLRALRYYFETVPMWGRR
jgi:hypothetical protein